MEAYSQYFTVKTNKPALSYHIGEEIIFFVFPRRNNGGCDYVIRLPIR